MNRTAPPDESGEMHDLAPAYALDALAPEEQVRFEAHLASCDACRAHVDEFRDTASSLAYDVDDVRPPEILERRILTAVRAERARRSRRPAWALPAAGVTAAAAAAVAVGLGIWATQLSHSLNDERADRRADARAVSILASRDARAIPLPNGRGKLVVAPNGQAVLVVSGMPHVAAGKTYEAWVVRGRVAQPAGLFRGGTGSSVLTLTERVRPGSVFGVTVENAGGSDKPTSPMIMSLAV